MRLPASGAGRRAGGICPGEAVRRLVASQNSFAVEIGFAARHVAGVVAVPVELQDQQGRAGGFAGEVLDVGIRPALEIGDVDHVQVGPAGGHARGFQNLAAGDPEHVGVEVVERLPAGHQEIERDDVGAVAVAQLARDIAVHAAIVDVVAAAGQHQAGLAGLIQDCQRAPAGFQQLVLELALRGVGGIGGARRWRGG